MCRTWTRACVLHIAQLFSSPHLSEALLSRECVRIGWLATAAKGRLGAPYFSWEKNQRDAAVPPLQPPHHPLHSAGTLPFQSFLRAQGKRKGLWNSFCLTVRSLGWPAGRGGRKICTVTMGRGEGRGHIRMASHLLSPPDGLTRQNRGCSSALFIMFCTSHKSEAACPGGVLRRVTEPRRPWVSPAVQNPLHGWTRPGQLRTNRAAAQFAQIFARFVLNRKSRERRWVPGGKHLSGGPTPCYLSGVMRFGMCVSSVCVWVCVGGL